MKGGGIRPCETLATTDRKCRMVPIPTPEWGEISEVQIAISLYHHSRVRFCFLRKLFGYEKI